MNGKNIEISLADYSRKRELVDLWIEAFGDCESFISSFIDGYMLPEYNVPVIIADGKIVSAFYLVEFELYSNLQSIGTCAYLFAAATKKEYRNRGYMSELIKYASDLYRNRGIKAVFLFPQGKELFDFYEKLGFNAIYQTKRLTVNSNFRTKPDDLTEFRLQNQSITDANVFDGLYNSYVEFTAKQSLAPMKDRLFYFKCASSYLETPESRFATFERINPENGNNVEIFCYVFYKKYKNTYYIDDIIIPEYIKIRESVHKNFTEITSVLTDYILDILSFGNNTDDISVEINTLPSSFSDSRNVKTAMIMPLSKDTSEIVKNLKSPVYLNMFFNI